jgi:hypothetical protein
LSKRDEEEGEEEKKRKRIWRRDRERGKKTVIHCPITETMWVSHKCQLTKWMRLYGTLFFQMHKHLSN